MKRTIAVRRMLAPALVLLPLLGSLSPLALARWNYYRLGNEADSAATPKSGIALMGGGGKQEAAFRFLCEQANGGDFLILRADTDEEYAREVNAEIKAICPLNSVGTIVFSDRDDSADPRVIEIIDRAEAIFFAGGDQSNYVRFWQDTPVQQALNRHIARAKPLGGSSAGLAILGEYSFSSMIDTIHSPEALADPYGSKVTLTREFLDVPLLRGTITDTHFVKRDRMGRLLVFLSRILEDGWASQVRAIAVEENAAVLLTADGTGRVVGEAPVYFLGAGKSPRTCKHRRPLAIEGISVWRVAPGGRFELGSWKGEGEPYTLAVRNGAVTSSSAAHQPY